MDVERWNQAKKPTTKDVAELSNSNSLTDYEDREAVFEQRRDVLTAVFKYVDNLEHLVKH